MIGYLSGQDEPILLTRDCPRFSCKFAVVIASVLPHNKSLIDQACSDKMVHWPHLFLCDYGSQLYLGPLTQKKKTWPVSCHLDLTLGQLPIYTISHFPKSYLMNMSERIHG